MQARHGHFPKDSQHIKLGVKTSTLNPLELTQTELILFLQICVAYATHRPGLLTAQQTDKEEKQKSSYKLHNEPEHLAHL